MQLGSLGIKYEASERVVVVCVCGGGGWRCQSEQRSSEDERLKDYRHWREGWGLTAVQWWESRPRKVINLCQPLLICPHVTLWTPPPDVMKTYTVTQSFPGFSCFSFSSKCESNRRIFCYRNNLRNISLEPSWASWKCWHLRWLKCGKQKQQWHFL